MKYIKKLFAQIIELSEGMTVSLIVNANSVEFRNVGAEDIALRIDGHQVALLTTNASYSITSNSPEVLDMTVLGAEAVGGASSLLITREIITHHV